MSRYINFLCPFEHENSRVLGLSLEPGEATRRWLRASLCSLVSSICHSVCKRFAILSTSVCQAYPSLFLLSIVERETESEPEPRGTYSPAAELFEPSYFKQARRKLIFGIKRTAGKVVWRSCVSRTRNRDTRCERLVWELGVRLPAASFQTRWLLTSTCSVFVVAAYSAILGVHCFLIQLQAGGRRIFTPLHPSFRIPRQIVDDRRTLYLILPPIYVSPGI